MAGILGLVGSARHWGNSELLVRHALRAAQAEGATVQMVRLSGLRIQPCTGCMHCVIGGKPCPIDDDMAWLAETIRAADGLVLAAPTYWLGPAAPVKLVLDRLLMVTGRVDAPLPPRRPALTIATAGLQGWTGVALPFLNALVAAFGFEPVDSLLAIAPGPGEVLLDPDLLDRVAADGAKLGRSEFGTPVPSPGACPVCHCQAFVLTGRQAVCPVCGRQATIEWEDEGARLRFDEVTEEHPRWTPEGLRQHMIDWVQATGPRFLEKYAEIRARRAPYRQPGLEWLCPPTNEA